MEKTIKDIIDTMTPEQRVEAYSIIGGSLQHSDINKNFIKEVFEHAKRDGSLKDSFLEHAAATYGIDGISALFPDAKLVNGVQSINKQVEWVSKVLNDVSKQPFARVKTMFADLTKETIRAKGYVKGTLKTEDVFALLKRSTDPATIYKKAKLDRDDIVDITDLDVVVWIKQIMKQKLDEELARAILIGDGRLSSDETKIDEQCIRPILNDEDLFTIKVAIDPNATSKYKAFIAACARSRKDYRGSGLPTLYTTEDLICEMLLLEDTTGRRLFSGIEDLKSTLRVSDIIPVSEMTGVLRKAADSGTKNHKVMGIIANLSDYSIGTNAGGKVSMFDDFDIDYNQQKYLIETRCSGALTVPYSAIVIEDVVAVPTP